MTLSKPVVLVDMSATLLHHGHIRLLQKASDYGYVKVALTTDEEILKHKGYTPELSYEHRKEILESISFVNEVVPSPWKLDLEYFLSTNADYLFHGDDNANDIPDRYLILCERTSGVSSSLLRRRVVETLLTLTFDNRHV